MIFLSPAKINLTLYINGKDKKDGYHYINSIMESVSLYDILDISISENPEIILIDKLNKLNIPAKKNLIYKAALLLQKKYNVKKGAIIKFYKNIPDGAGLGGGSSNAATVLKALNLLWDLRLSVRKLEELAKYIGSDVPFFIKAQYAIVTGKGDKIKVLNRRKKNWYVIVVPKKIKINTSMAYKWYDKNYVLTKTITYSKLNNKILHNDFELSVLKNKVLLRKIKEKIIAVVNNEKKVSLSGSGSAFFSLCETKKCAEIIFNKLKKNLRKCYIYMVHSI